MVRINENYAKAKKNYLFLEISKRTAEFRKKNPKANLLTLGIGNTTLPLTTSVIRGLTQGVKKLGSQKTYTGYGDEQGNTSLRNAITAWYKKRGIDIDVNEIFVSDGAKPDSANIQSIFAKDTVVAIQDPSYPVYVESNVIAGKKIVYMPCIPENDFDPTLPKTHVDLIYICSPNNPTGVTLSKKQLKTFVDYANKNKAIIVFDAAYFAFIKDPKLPKSIYEIPGAKTCAIEINSFSKLAGFTGVRLGWTVVPHALKGQGITKGQVNAVWRRRQTTMFNGASNIAQEGGIAVLSPQGYKECQRLVDYYMENTRVIKESLKKLSYTVYGGDNAPYLWVKTPGKFSSWEFFDLLLKKAHVVATPGVGFGPNGEGFIRFSAFGSRENIIEAMKRISKLKIAH